LIGNKYHNTPEIMKKVTSDSIHLVSITKHLGRKLMKCKTFFNIPDNFILILKFLKMGLI